MTDQTLLRIGVALVLGAVAFGVVFRLGIAAGSLDEPGPADARRAGARRRLRILTGAAGALALGVTAILAILVPTATTQATGTGTGAEDAPPTDAPAADQAVDPAAAIDEALPAIEQGAQAGDGALDDRSGLDDGAYGDDDGGFQAPPAPPEGGERGDGGFGSGGS